MIDELSLFLIVLLRVEFVQKKTVNIRWFRERQCLFAKIKPRFLIWFLQHGYSSMVLEQNKCCLLSNVILELGY